MEKKLSKKPKLTEKESFFSEFAREIDIFYVQASFPEWVYEYREGVLNRIRREFRVMCQFLKDAGVSFYIKYPIEIGGKWKFADVFIPGSGIVVLLLSEFESIGLPCHSKTDREIWFSGKYKTVGIYTSRVDRTLDILSRAI